jgi:hypothetical protein
MGIRFYWFTVLSKEIPYKHPAQQRQRQHSVLPHKNKYHRAINHH